MGTFRVITVAAVLVALVAPTSAQAAKPRGPMVVSSNLRALPKRYTKGAYCATLQIRDYRGTPIGDPGSGLESSDGVAEFTFVWHIPGKQPGTMPGHWNGVRVVPTGPVPRIAALSARGAIAKGYGFDRRVCTNDKRLAAPSTDDSLRGVKAMYRKRTDQRLQSVFGAADYIANSAVFTQAYADKLNQQAAQREAAAAAAAAAAATKWQANIDAWQAQCTHGQIIRVQHGDVLETWTCLR